MPLFTILSLLILNILNTVINGVPTIALVETNETDGVALLAIKSMISPGSDHLGVLNSWNDSSHFCEWKGVECGQRHKRVVAVNLESYGLVGSLSPFIGNLTFLRFLDLSNNTFSGHIPPQIGHLFRLQQLSLLNNSFGGEIPRNISGCKQLFFIQLTNNKLVGKLPYELSFLSKLEYLGLSNNENITGDLLPLSNLTSLRILSIANAFPKGPGFTGRLPDFLGKFKNMTILELGGNSFTGQIPLSLYNLSNLQELDLASNQLQGALSPAIGFHFPKLGTLQLFDNQLTGPIPFSLSNLSNLELLEIFDNNFIGKFLFDGSRMQNLDYLDVGNALLGRREADGLDFLNTLVNCTYLIILLVNNNNLGGKLPPSIANLTVNIRELALSGNDISGSIPSGLGNLLSLQRLGLDDNKITGVIPPDFSKISRLEAAFLDKNLLSGTIPLSLGNLSKLSVLNLSYNNFHGVVPATLGDCKSLIALDLSHNQLVGSLSHKLFEAPSLLELHLQENMLQGSLPSEFGELKNLVFVDMSNNNLYGNIPYSLGQCVALINLYFNGNSFDGSIPSSLSNLQSLQVIDLSNNKLSGQVPKYFANFSYLTYLNLSFNNLDGDVPTKGVFANVSEVFLLGNNKLCGGIPQLKLPRCALTKLRAKKKSHALVFAISVSCFFVVVAIASLSYMVFTKRKEQASSETLMTNEPFIQVSYGMLQKATNDFSLENLIGSGSFSRVYKGTLLADRVEKSVAIKVINNQRQGGSQSFLAECEALRVIRHRNLVRVVTACSSIDFQGNVFHAIVYELMSKGSLDRWLYTDLEIDEQFQGLNLLQRLNIALDVAHALDYIQSVCKTPFVHCDLKPSNILLDDELVAHIGDFGLVKLPPEIANGLPNYVSLGVRGTVGYTAPEYGVGTSMSAAGDIYSYGIILLELMTAKKPTDVMFEGDMNLHNFAKSALPDTVQDILDPKLKVHYYNEEITIDLNDTRDVTKCVFECIASMITIGVQCSSEFPQDRMDIKDVIRQLKSQKDKLPVYGK